MAILPRVPDTKMLDDLAGNRTGLPPTRDRLLTTTFFAAALHALVILGVTFAPPRGGRGSEPPSLAVLVVHDPVAETELNKNADYLAQVNQRGSGTDRDVRGAESPRASADASGDEGKTDSGRRARTADAADDEDLVATRAARHDRRYFAHGTVAAQGSPLVLEPLATEADGADTGQALELRGTPQHELLVTANTRESSVAIYLDRWRHRIERIGAANYPLDAARRAGFTGNPVLDVRILADGRLGDVVIKRSSGFPTLDQAALGILKLSAPFEPFPRQLAARHDALRISYEWQFLGGEAGETTVRMPADTR